MGIMSMASVESCATPEKQSKVLASDTPRRVNTKIPSEIIECRDWWRCPSKHQAMDELSMDVVMLAQSRAFARSGGLERWLASCGVPSSSIELLMVDATQAEKERFSERNTEIALPAWHSATSRLLGSAVKHKTAERDSLCGSGL